MSKVLEEAFEFQKVNYKSSVLEGAFKKEKVFEVYGAVRESKGLY